MENKKDDMLENLCTAMNWLDGLQQQEDNFDYCKRCINDLLFEVRCALERLYGKR